MEENKFPRQYSLLNIFILLILETFKTEKRNTSSANIKSGILEIDERLVLLIREESRWVSIDFMTKPPVFKYCFAVKWTNRMLVSS